MRLGTRAQVLLLVIAVSVSVLALTLPGGAGAMGAAKSRVTLHIKKSKAKFRGRVSSQDDSCVVGRKVLIIRKHGNHRVTKTFASESGRYAVTIPMQSGKRFYAKVKTTLTPTGTTCRPDRSKTKRA